MNRERTQERKKKYEERLALYYKAEEAVLSGSQSYRIGSRELTRADLAEIRKMIKDLEDAVDELESALAGNGRRRTMRVIPRDV